MGKGTHQIATFADLQDVGYRIPLSSNVNRCITYNDLSIMNNATLLPFQTKQKSNWTYGSAVTDKLVQWLLVPGGSSTIQLTNNHWINVPSSAYDAGPTVGIEFSVATTSQSQPFPSGTVLLIKVYLEAMLSDGSRSTPLNIKLYSDAPTRTIYFPIGTNAKKIFITYETGSWGIDEVNSVKASTPTITNGDINLDGTTTYNISRNSVVLETYDNYHDFVRNVFSIVFNLTLRY